jgi:hypothetical protein
MNRKEGKIQFQGFWSEVRQSQEAANGWFGPAEGFG